ASSLWAFGGQWISPTAAILPIISAMLLVQTLEWADVVGSAAAWDTLLYFATLLSLADGLTQLGIVAWAARGVSSLLSGSSPVLAIVVLVSFFFMVHYMFASLSAHTMVVLPALLTAGAAIPGMPVRVLALLL